ncbi:MAG TPA: hypothetical protein PLF13_14885 [candidate division Zixibacteria bacterium]|nr:hypothetical protein [candidate division Zixibacteria bacterium]
MNEITVPQPANADTVQETTKPLSKLRIMAGIYHEPGRSFRAVATKPCWILPLLLVIVTAFTQLLVTNDVRLDDAERRIRSDASLSPQEVQAYQDNIDAQRVPGWEWSGIAYGLGFVALAKIMQIVPAAFFIWLGLLFGVDRSRFTAVLSVVALAFLVQIPEALVVSGLTFAKGTCLITLGPAVVLPPEWKDSPLYNLLFQLDLGNVWIVSLLIIGLPRAGGASKRLAAVTVSYLWAIWLLINMFVGRLIQIS